jgi:eukaryotic-like serine/threonine-protein kinase
MLKKFGIIFVFIFAILLIFNSLIMPWYVKHADLVTVPEVTGMSFLDAKKVLEDSGLEVKQGDIRYDEAKPVGLVLDQSPSKSETVKKGRRVYLTICGGEQLMEVPRLTGKSERDAKFSLEQRNLKVGEIVRKFTTEQPEDAVISQIIQPGSKVKKFTKVDLIISNGPVLGDIIIPDVVGKKLADAKKLLEEKKLRTGKITYQPSDVIPGIVIDQYPKREKSAKDNTPIDLIVSKKKTETDKAFEDVGDIDGKTKNGTEPKEKTGAEIKNKPNPEKQTDPDKNTEKLKDKPTDKPVDKPKEKAVEKPKEKTIEKQKEKTPEMPK